MILCSIDGLEMKAGDQFVRTGTSPITVAHAHHFDATKVDVQTLTNARMAEIERSPTSQSSVTNVFPSGTLSTPTSPTSIAHVIVDSMPTVSVGVVVGGSTSAKQDTQITSLGSIDTKLTNPLPVSGTVTANVGTGTQPVSASALPLPTGASTSALQTQPGVDIGDVTINNATGAAAVNIQDGGNSITVDGTVTATIAANQSVNLAQVAGTTTDVNSGTKSAGTQRVVLATDQPALTNALKVDGSAVTQPVSGTVSANATLSAETTKVIGTINISASQTVGLVAGSAVIGHVINDASSAVIGHVIHDSGSTTVVTGNVTAVQATGTNLHVVVDSAPSTVVTGPLTDTQLRATPVPVSGTVTATPTGTQAISASSLPLPTGAATEASVLASATVLGTQADDEIDGDADGTIASRLKGMSLQLDDIKQEVKDGNTLLFQILLAIEANARIGV